VSVHLKVTSLRLSENTEKPRKVTIAGNSAVIEVRNAGIKSVTSTLRQRSRYAEKICFTNLL